MFLVGIGRRVAIGPFVGGEKRSLGVLTWYEVVVTNRHIKLSPILMSRRYRERDRPFTALLFETESSSSSSPKNIHRACWRRQTYSNVSHLYPAANTLVVRTSNNRA